MRWQLIRFCKTFNLIFDIMEDDDWCLAFSESGSSNDDNLHVHTDHKHDDHDDGRRIAEDIATVPIAAGNAHEAVVPAPVMPMVQSWVDTSEFQSRIPTCTREDIDNMIASRQKNLEPGKIEELQAEQSEYDVQDWLNKSKEWQNMNTSYSTWFDESESEQDDAEADLHVHCTSDKASTWGSIASSDVQVGKEEDNLVTENEKADTNTKANLVTENEKADTNTKASTWGSESTGENFSSSSEEVEGTAENTEHVPPQKKRRFSSIPHVVDVIQRQCCVDKCMKMLSINDVEECQNTMASLNENQQLNFIMKDINDHTIIKKHANTLLDNIYNFVIAGKSVCRVAWSHAFNVSNGRFRDAVQNLKKGYIRQEHGNKGRRRSTVKTTNATGWMRHNFDRIGDFMPHKDQIHLPSTWTKTYVYNKMRKEHVDRGIPASEVISESHFRTIWKQQFSEYVISKVHGEITPLWIATWHLTHCAIMASARVDRGGHDFTVCSTCSRIKEQTKAARSTKEHEEVKLLKEEHHLQVRKERSAYHKMRERAQREHEEYTVMIVDGMDQSKTNIPRMVKDKDLAPLSRVHTHLTGVLLYTKHSEGKIPLIYTDIKEIPHDSNTTINIILQTLTQYKTRLGRILFLQLDNCFRENKNKFLLAFASLLVEHNIFEEVIVHFLPVGHTHEDVDQLFSRIAKALKEHIDIYTLDDLIPIIVSSFTPRVKVMPARKQFNFKEWIGNHLAGRFQNHSKPLWFRFRRADGVVRMHYKMWVDDKWLPEEEVGQDGTTVEEDSKGLVCLQSIPDITDIPEWVIPSLCKLDVEALRKDLPHAYGDRMPTDRQEWWQHFMDNIENLTDVPPHADTWPLVELANRITHVEPVWEAQSEQLESIRQKIHQPCPTVRIGTQGKTTTVVNVNTYDSLKIEDLVVVNLENSEGWEEPFIGSVLEMNDTEVKIQWMKGSYSKAWKKWVDGVGRNSKPNVDLIPINSIIFFGFKLNPLGHLKRQDAVSIRKLYSGL